VKINIKKKLDHRSDYDTSIDSTLLNILEEIPIATVGKLREEYHKRTGRLLSWLTVKRHIDSLLDTNNVEILMDIGTEKRKTVVYKLR